MNHDLEQEDVRAALNGQMLADFHIFASTGERTFTVQEPGLAESQEFSSLFEATQHLRREQQPSNDRWVVIHDEEGHLNRIPLHLQ